MKYVSSTIFSACLLALLTSPAQGLEPIRFGRTPDISPDGQLVAFSYLGDIYTVESIGGIARPLTTHPAHDIHPAFSPDGRYIAFSSNRHGGYDVFVVPVRGGKPARLTYDSGADLVCGWSPDSKHILFSSARHHYFPPGSELYSVPVEGGRIQRLTSAEAKEGTFSPAGDQIAFTRGPGSWYRKGYRGSANDDIWLCRADGSDNRRITTFNGQDHSPLFSQDGQTLFYVSEQFGVANLVRLPLGVLASSSAQSIKPVQLTQHSDEAVRRARISSNGEWIVYECGPDLWVVSTRDGSRPRKLVIEVNADEKTNNEQVVTFSRGATEYALSADEKFVVFAVQGKLFRMGINPATRPVQLTFGPSNDHGAFWSPDGSKIIFISDRNGAEDLYLLEANDPEHPKLTEAHQFKVTQLTDTREAEMGVSFAPDGKRIAFVRGGKLWTMTPDGKEARAVVDEVSVFNYDWSPDSRWLVYARRDGSFASDLYIVPATGPTVTNPIRNITRYSTFNAGVSWSANGKRLAFVSERRLGAYLHVMDLEKPTAQDETNKSANVSLGWVGKPPLTIDWDDLHLRVRSVLRGAVDEAAISPDSSKIAYRDPATRDLWLASTSGSQILRITTGGLAPRQIRWSTRKGLLGATAEQIYFLDGTGSIRTCSPGGTVGTLPFKVRMTVRQDELFAEMFEQSWRYLSEYFYDPKFHDCNWDEVRKRYRPLLKHVALKEDLYALLYLMLGELNASHLGVSSMPVNMPEETAELGLFFDESYKGKGLKISEILKRGPADRKGVQLKPGEFVVAIDGVELNEKVNLSKLLQGKVEEAIILHVSANAADPKAPRRRVELMGMSRQRATSVGPALAELMYDRWVARNAARVSELSGGKLGYIHIPSMDEQGLDRFVRALYSENFDKDAIVLDVRYNGGGFTHDQILNYLGSREHTVFRDRQGGQGAVLRSGDRKWHKPLILLINNRAFSDAEIFPNAFRTLELGKLVGEPTGGMVIGTSAVQLVDGSLFRIPRIGVYTTQGVSMDREGVQPDVLVENHPDQLARGQDAQLERAVELLQADVLAWKKKNTPDPTAGPLKGRR